MITIPVNREALAELLALGRCDDCLGEAVLVADRLDVNAVAVNVRAAVAHSSETCPAVLALPRGATFLVVPPGGGS